MAWDEPFDATCSAWAKTLSTGDPAARAVAWRRLLVAVSPEIERWAATHPTLRRWRLAGPDDAREVLVRVLERLAANHWASLGEYTARRARTVADPLARLAQLDAIDDDDAPAATPFRAWLRVVLSFAVHDHVRHRLGWTEGVDRRAIGSHAPRLSQAPEPGARPPVTDWITVKERMVAVDAAVDALPEPMRTAVRAWADGDDFATIAARIGGAEDEARRLVRAGHARLRGALRAVSDD